MYMEAYSAVTYLGVHVLVDLCPVEHGSIVLVDVDSSHTCTYAEVCTPRRSVRLPKGIEILRCVILGRLIVEHVDKSQ